MHIRTQADDFLNAYRVLKKNDEAIIETLSATNAKTTPITHDDMQITGGAHVVCLSFAVELYLKNLHYVVTGEVPRGHNILKLFKELPEGVREKVIEHPSILNYGWTADDGLKNEIEAISDGFEKWRYSYESNALRYNIGFARTFITALVAVADAITHAPI